MSNVQIWVVILICGGAAASWYCYSLGYIRGRVSAFREIRCAQVMAGDIAKLPLRIIRPTQPVKTESE